MLIQYLFEVDGVSEKICQDPLEKFFGRQRQRGAVNENPTVYQFLKNNQALRVVDSIRIETSKGNTRGLSSSSEITVDSGIVPKRKRRKIHETHMCNTTNESLDLKG